MPGAIQVISPGRGQVKAPATDVCTVFCFDANRGVVWAQTARKAPMRLTNIGIYDFKRVKAVEFDLEDVSLLIGGNNSGKSSVLQAIHFAVSCFRAARAFGKTTTQPATTLAVNQFSYRPSNDLMRLRHSSAMTQSAGPSIRFRYIHNDGSEKEAWLRLYRGKNANIQLGYSSATPLFSSASDQINPFSIFVPGLAGLSLQEERRPNSVVTYGIAQGDSNLYLRNVLNRLCLDDQKLQRFHDMIAPMFPGIEVMSSFDEDIDQFIDVRVRISGHSVPLELAGTGALQAIQLAAYVTLYEPKLLLLDEPDAHLHPGNQKQLVDLVFEISSSTSTQVLMASHSRHVLDRVLHNPLGQTVWLKNGSKQDNSGADLPLLLDIGALDQFEELSRARTKKLVFCEDTKIEKIDVLLRSSGINPDDIHLVSYDGVDNLTATAIVVEFFLSLGPGRKALVYRDGDCMTPEEKAWLKGKAAKELPESATLYISRYTDIEHGLCDPEHISTVTGLSLSDAQELVSEAVSENQARLASKATSKRSDLKFKVLKDCDVSASADSLFKSGITFEYALGKLLLPRVREKLTARGLGNVDLNVQSPALSDADLSAIFS